MPLFEIGLFVFLGLHVFSSTARGPRAAIIGSVGEGAYKITYALLAIASLALLIVGWRAADITPLYTPAPFLRHLTHLLMLISIILLVAAYTPAGRIAAAVKHPMVLAIKVWALSHLLVNGEMRSVLLFGGFLAFGVIDRIALKRRNAPVRTAGAAHNDLVAIAIGAAAYLLIAFYLHEYIAGVRVFAFAP
ncbi:MAG: NnrU family protein [Pseudomonadota bacterium]